MVDTESGERVLCAVIPILVMVFAVADTLDSMARRLLSLPPSWLCSVWRSDRLGGFRHHLAKSATSACSQRATINVLS